MKLSVKGLAFASGVTWAVVILFVGTINLLVPSYGFAFLDFIDSIYPGYHQGSGFSGVVIGTLYGLLDASIGGAIFAWLYNLFVP